MPNKTSKKQLYPTYTEYTASEDIVNSEFNRMMTLCVPGKDGCLEWTGRQDYQGYGRITGSYAVASPNGNPYSRSRFKCSRLSYIANNGPIAKGMVVRHKCDNPKCVNPLHLELGTIADNNRDAWARGRRKLLGNPGDPAAMSGEQNRLTELTNKQALLIATCTNKTRFELMAEFGVSYNVVRGIQTGFTWGAVTGIEYKPKPRNKD